MQAVHPGLTEDELVLDASFSPWWGYGVIALGAVGLTVGLVAVLLDSSQQAESWLRILAASMFALGGGTVVLYGYVLTKGARHLCKINRKTRQVRVWLGSEVPSEVSWDEVEKVSVGYGSQGTYQYATLTLQTKGGAPFVLSAAGPAEDLVGAARAISDFMTIPAELSPEALAITDAWEQRVDAQRMRDRDR